MTEVVKKKKRYIPKNLAEKRMDKVRCTECRWVEYENGYASHLGGCSNDRNKKCHGRWNNSTRILRLCEFFEVKDARIGIAVSIDKIERAINRMGTIEYALEHDSGYYDGEQRRSMADEYDKLKILLVEESKRIPEYAEELSAIVLCI